MRSFLVSCAVALLAVGCSSSSSVSKAPATGGGAGQGGSGGASGAGGLGGSSGSAGSAGAAGSGGGLSCPSSPTDPPNPTAISALASSAPHVAAGPCDEFAIVWLTQADKHVHFATSRALESPIDLGPSNGGAPRVAYSAGSSFAQRKYMVAWIETAGAGPDEGIHAVAVIQPGVSSPGGTVTKATAGLTGSNWRFPNLVGIGQEYWLLSVVARSGSEFQQGLQLVNSSGNKDGSQVLFWNKSAALGPGTLSVAQGGYTLLASVGGDARGAADVLPSGLVLAVPNFVSLANPQLRSGTTRPQTLRLSASESIHAFDSPSGITVVSNALCADQLGASDSVLGLARCGAKNIALLKNSTNTALHPLTGCTLDSASIPLTGLDEPGNQEAALASTDSSVAVAWTEASGPLFMRVQATNTLCP